MNPHLILMQDGAPGHAAKDTLAELECRGITVIEWPSYSLISIQLRPYGIK